MMKGPCRCSSWNPVYILCHFTARMRIAKAGLLIQELSGSDGGALRKLRQYMSRDCEDQCKDKLLTYC